MAVTFLIPTALRAYADNNSKVEVDGLTVQEALSNLVGRYDTLKKHLYNKNSELRSFVNIYVGDEDIRYLEGVDTKLSEAASISIVPSIAGGLD